MMRWISALPLRVRTLLQRRRMERELHEEFAFHLEQKVNDLIERGSAPDQARRFAMKAMKVERQMEQCRDERAGQWLERLKVDVVFGWRQLKKRKVTTAAAILSLGLGIGSCVAAFRLVDAMLLRPLPIIDPARLYALRPDGYTFEGKPAVWDTVSYPAFSKMREAVKGQAELIAISETERIEVTYGSDQEIERAKRQFVSGWMFSSFGLRPALGRLFTEDDDRVPGQKPYAVISYTYWKSRFGRDPKVIGRSLRIGNQMLQIVGVSEERFNGTEPGVIPDIYLPVMMNKPGDIGAPGAEWLRAFVRPNPGAATEPIRDRAYTAYITFQRERAKGWKNIPKNLVDDYLRMTLRLTPARSGVSQTKEDYQQALLALAALVVMVLLIACANVANLMTAQAAMRAREIALRVSIGAGRMRLMQMMLVESLMLALAAAAFGGLFACWAAPFVVNRINPPDNPVQLMLPADWRVLGFGLLLTLGVVLLFGLVPALRASSVQPAAALKGSEEPLLRQRSMHGLIAAQVAFCFVVLFLGGLFGQTFERLSNKPLGFSADRVLLLDTVAQHAQPAAMWQQMVEHLKTMPGVQEAALASWGLVKGESENNLITVDGVPSGNMTARSLGVSPGWLETMRVPLLAGRDFRATDASPEAAIVNRTFARAYFGGQNPVGRHFELLGTHGLQNPYEVVGLAEDAAYKDVHDDMLPVMYVPMPYVDPKGVLQPMRGGVFVMKTSGDPSLIAPVLRQEIQRVQPEFRVSNITTQTELVRAQMIRERMLAALAGFFAGVALLLAAIGLYGVLHYSVVQREREIGIRIALGAAAANIARIVTTRVMAMVLLGAAIGLAAGIASVHFVSTLLYGVKGTELSMMVLPGAVLLFATACAALPAVLRAVRMDPVVMLRSE